MIRRLMQNLFFYVAVLISGLLQAGQAGQAIFLEKTDQDLWLLTIDGAFHEKFGFACPITYEFALPYESSDLAVFRYLTEQEDWQRVTEKQAGDLFNGIDAVRFDYPLNRAYVSLTFPAGSDSILFSLQDSGGQPVDALFTGITKFYDNRRAAVTSSADDWADWSAAPFLRAAREFRNRGLWLSTGIITGGCSDYTWEQIQYQLDAGYIEASAHSRSHPASAPYNDPEYEIGGCRRDILDNLDLPAGFRKGDHEYLYTWIAPNGYSDEVIMRTLSRNNYLINRLYNDGLDDYADWNDHLQMFNAFNVTKEVGPLWLGTNNLFWLNSSFDEALDKGGIYHLMCHPNVLEWDKNYTGLHLDYISSRSDVWYAALGHIYVYRLAWLNGPPAQQNRWFNPDRYTLKQNYPNPFNNQTALPYELPESGTVEIAIYDALGRKIFETSREHASAGIFSLSWQPNGQASGLYFYIVRFKGQSAVRRMVLLK